MELKLWLLLLADSLETHIRMGAEEDKPEGARFIAISETLATQIAADSRKLAAGVAA